MAITKFLPTSGDHLSPDISLSRLNQVSLDKPLVSLEWQYFNNTLLHITRYGQDIISHVYNGAAHLLTMPSGMLTSRGDCKLIHSNLKYGENMFWGKGNRWKPSDAVAAWAIQESYYNYKSNTCMPNKECLHYTQIVWKTTTKVSCAQIRCRTGDTLIVCEYDPHDNVSGERPY